MTEPFTLSVGAKLLIWFLFVVFLPVLTVFFIKRVLDMESNFANFMLLAAFTVLDMALAWILTGLRMPGFWRGLLIVLSGIAAGFYNTHACALIKKYRS